METAIKASRIIRIMKICFLVYGASLILVVYRVPAKVRHPPNSSFELAISLVAIVNVALGFFPPQFLSKLTARSSASQRASTPLQLWMTRSVSSMALFLSCVLFGLVLHFVGAQLHLVELLFTVGLLSLLFWSPGTPPGTEDEAINRF